MRFYFRKTLFLLSLSFICVDYSNAQTVAILDQGYNSSTSHRGTSKFVHQNCISYSYFFDTVKPSPNPLTHYLGWRASLCANGQSGDFYRTNSANHPRTNVRGFPGAPTTFYKTSSRLEHGRDVSNALWDFDRTISQSLFQVYGFNGNADVNGDQSPDPIIDQSNLQSTLNDQRRYQTNGGTHIADALNFLSYDTDPNLAAVSISTVVGNGISTPFICNTGLGQDAVGRLRARGIAVVTGLLNRDIPASTKTWPNCLIGVINAGNTNTRGTPNGIGIGANGVDFYMNSLTSAPGQSFPEQGNSLAAPKIAGAFALLHKQFPNSSVDQKYQALVRARNSFYTYQGVKKRRLRKSHMSDAIGELNIIVNGLPNNPPDDVVVDEGFYGLAYGGASSDKVQLGIDFAELLGTNKTRTLNLPLETKVEKSSKAIISERDVELVFTGLFDDSNSARRKFRILVNNIEVLTTDAFTNNIEETKSYIVNRNYFKSGDNVLEIIPTSSSSKWGVKDIVVSLLPTIPLEIGVIDRTIYGSSENPTRYTGARFTFSTDDSSHDLVLLMTGYDTDSNDETQVFINEISLGYLPVSSNDSFGEPIKFRIPKALIQEGVNLIELSQKKPNFGIGSVEDQKWAVKDVILDIAVPDMAIDSLEITSESVRANTSFDTKTKVINLGDTPSSFPVFARFYVSNDEVIDSSDEQISLRLLGEIKPDQIFSFLKTGLKTESVQNHFLAICIDPVPNEVKIDNNCSEAIPLGNAAATIAPVLMLLLDGG